MKKILCFLVIGLMAVNISGSHAHDTGSDVDFHDLKTEYKYDGGDDELEITITFEDIDSRPSEDYEIELEVDGRDYEKDLSYSSSRDELYATFTFDDISSSELDDYMDLEIKIRDEDNDVVFNKDVELSGSTGSNSDDFDWDDLEVETNYSASRDRLHIEISLEDITSSPENTYRTYIEVDNKDYDERMYYSSSNDRLQANFYISNVDEDDLDDYEDIDIKIKDTKGNTLFNDTIDIDSGSSSSSSSSSDEDWSNLAVNADYNTDRKRLTYRIELDNVSGNAESNVRDGEYKVIFSIDGRRYVKNAFFSNVRQAIYSYHDVNVFSESRLKTSYNVGVTVEKNGDEVYSKTSNVRLTKNAHKSSSTSSTTTSTSSTNHNSSTSTSQTRSNAQTFAYRYILRMEAKYQSSSARKAQLSRMIQALENVKSTYSNQAYVNEVILTMKTKLAEYNGSGTGSSHTGGTTNKVVPTPNVNRTIKPAPGTGRWINTMNGPFYYYGGYNY